MRIVRLTAPVGRVPRQAFHVKQSDRLGAGRRPRPAGHVPAIARTRPRPARSRQAHLHPARILRRAIVPQSGCFAWNPSSERAAARGFMATVGSAPWLNQAQGPQRATGNIGDRQFDLWRPVAGVPRQAFHVKQGDRLGAGRSETIGTGPMQRSGQPSPAQGLDLFVLDRRVPRTSGRSAVRVLRVELLKRESSSRLHGDRGPLGYASAPVAQPAQGPSARDLKHRRSAVRLVPLGRWRAAPAVPREQGRAHADNVCGYSSEGQRGQHRQACHVKQSRSARR
jgi:hypothetical protein